MPEFFESLLETEELLDDPDGLVPGDPEIASFDRRLWERRSLWAMVCEMADNRSYRQWFGRMVAKAERGRTWE